MSSENHKKKSEKAGECLRVSVLPGAFSVSQVHPYVIHTETSEVITGKTHTRTYTTQYKCLITNVTKNMIEINA